MIRLYPRSAAELAADAALEVALGFAAFNKRQKRARTEYRDHIDGVRVCKNQHRTTANGGACPLCEADRRGRARRAK